MSLYFKPNQIKIWKDKLKIHRYVKIVKKLEVSVDKIPML